ncbi:hypothetical protein, partial [Anaerosporobacter faecicola]|uniref:hypothetical protein n=1 Tax=Anaerosporobacter faecicola TaxID=2718714 RepID=UPI001A9AD2EA
LTKVASHLQSSVKVAFRLQKMILDYKHCISSYKVASHFTSHHKGTEKMDNVNLHNAKIHYYGSNLHK